MDNNKLKIAEQEQSKPDQPKENPKTEDSKKAHAKGVPTATRHDLQISRRFFHFLNGFSIAMAYQFFFTHTRIVSLLGTIACLIYLFEQLRISYPGQFKKMSWLTNLFLRAEEELKESSMIPYVMAVLLSILTFPKPVAIVAILSLAIADPLSAIIGIRFGKRRVVKHKSLEGSAAFFIATFAISSVIFYRADGQNPVRPI